jgi:hypothetical protein
MAQTGFTPIQIYSSSTAAAAPTAGNLANSTLGSELAINITDGKLFYKDNANAIQVIGWKTVPTTAGGTGLTSYTAGDLLFYASGTALSKLAIGVSGRYLSSSGTAPQWNAPAALTKTDDTNVTLTLGGSASTALLNAASLTLGWTGTLSVARGGTGAGSITSGYFLQGNGTSAFSGSTRLYTDGTNMFSDCSYRAQVQSGATNNTAPTAIIVSNKTTGSAAAGLGAALEFNYFDSGGGYAGGKIAAVALGDPFTADIVFYPRNYGYAEAGRFKSTGDLSLVNNLVIGTSGKGIDFSATPGTGTSELLNDYEEGTWTPAPNSGTFSSAAGQYTKVGRVVTLQFTVTVGTGGGTSMTGNPFTTYGGSNAVAFSSTMYTEGQTYPAGATTAQVLLGGGGSTINFVGVGSVIGFTSLTLSAGAVLIGSITYIT